MQVTPSSDNEVDQNEWICKLTKSNRAVDCHSPYSPEINVPLC